MLIGKSFCYFSDVGVLVQSIMMDRSFLVWRIGSEIDTDTDRGWR